jgi:ferredoxin
MALLTYRDRPIDLGPGETVLSALLREGIDAPNSCRAGVCQTCLHRAVEGELEAGLREEVAIECVIRIAKEHELAPIAAPRDMRRRSRKDNASAARHGERPA